MLGSFEEALEWCLAIASETSPDTRGGVYISAHGPEGGVNLDGIPTIGITVWTGTAEEAEKILTHKH